MLKIRKVSVDLFTARSRLKCSIALALPVACAGSSCALSDATSTARRHPYAQQDPNGSRLSAMMPKHVVGIEVGSESRHAGLQVSRAASGSHALSGSPSYLAAARHMLQDF